MRHALFVEPLDTLFFRGSRALGPGEAPDSGLPFPQTFAGAVRSALLQKTGFDFDHFAARRREGLSVETALAEARAPKAVVEARFLGPVLGRRRSSASRRVEPLFAVPRVLRRVAKGRHQGPLLRAHPSEHPVLLDLYGRRPEGGPDLPLWLAEGRPTEPASGYVSGPTLSRFLRAEPVEASSILEPGELYSLDRRVSTALDEASGAAKTAQLYALGLLLLRPEIGFYVEIEGEPELSALWKDGLPLQLGGEARRALAREVDGAASVDVPPAGASRHCLVLLTPGDFGPSAVPDGLFNARVRAASVGKLLLHSGFDLARGGPRATRSFAPAGSTYFVEGKLPSFPSCSGRAPLAAQGEGWFVRGVWL